MCAALTERACVLNPDKRCTGCGACDRCDLDPSKICDNCMKCLEQPDQQDGYRTMKVGRIVLEGAAYEKWLGRDESSEATNLKDSDLE